MSQVEVRHSMDMVRWLGQSVKNLVEESATAIEGRAAALAPSDTNALRDSIKRKIISAVEAEVGSNQDYAAHVEYGTGDKGAGGGEPWVYFNEKLGHFVTTSGMAAANQGKGFMRPAVDETKRDMNRIWQSAKERG